MLHASNIQKRPIDERFTFSFYFLSHYRCKHWKREIEKTERDRARDDELQKRINILDNTLLSHVCVRYNTWSANPILVRTDSCLIIYNLYRGLFIRANPALPPETEMYTTAICVLKLHLSHNLKCFNYVIEEERQFIFRQNCRSNPRVRSDLSICFFRNLCD